MTGSSILKVERKTREGHTIRYTLCLPPDLRRIDYEVDPDLGHNQIYFQVKDLTWKGKRVDAFFMPMSSMMPSLDLPLESHSVFLMEEDASQAFAGALNILDVGCVAKMDSVFEEGVWKPRVFKVGIFEREDILGEIMG